MDRNGSHLEKIYLNPGELLVTEEPVMVATVLGSCVSVTMFSRQTGAAAICHGMLPTGGLSDNFKYVDTSVRYMVKYFQRLKVPRTEIEVKLFGGSDMFSNGRAAVRNLTVGWQNISVATRCLAEYGLAPAASDVGGKKGRKLVFTTDNGVVFIKKMRSQYTVSNKNPLYL